MSTAAYADFDLLVDRGSPPTGYRARVIQSPAGEAVTDFTLPFSSAELADFLQGIDQAEPRRRAASAEAGPTLDPRTFGTRLYDAVFAGPVGLCLRRSLDEVARRGVGLRLRLRLAAGALDLAELPWEFLFARDLGRFLALSDLTPLVRYSELDRPSQPLRAQLPLTVLAICASPSDLAPLAVGREWQNLQDALAPLIQRGALVLERLPAATLPALQERLRRGPVDLLHFVGHGFFDRQSNTGGLVFENARGRTEVVTAETLGVLLHDHEALRLIFLNACQTAEAGPRDPFAGVAQRLVQQGAPAVLAMQFPVSDDAAAALAQTFYQALADGLPADAALSQARKAIAAQGNAQEWATPVLFSRADDNRLFDLLDALPAPACPYPGMVPFRVEDARFFYGREQEIEQVQRHLRQQRLLFVIGPSGSGKSSLLAAGVLPRLAGSAYFPPGYWLVRTLRPGGHPLAALAAALAGDLSRPAEAVAQLLAANAPAQRLLLVIDQFEEIFSLAEAEQRQAFMACFQALRGVEQCALVAAMRADFYPELMNSELWPVDASQRLEIAALRGDALRRAIRQPADEVEVEVEDALIERLLADAAGEPGALPMLQETLQLLWARMRRRRLTPEDYDQLGDGQRSGLAVAIATKADATLAELAPDEQGVARRIFLRLIQFGQGRLDTRRQLPEAELRSASRDPALCARVLKQLAGNRLLTLSGGEGGAERLVDIAHERLITEWPRLGEWVKQHKAAELVRRRLEDKAQEWVRLGRGEGGLLDKAELAEAGDWLAGAGAAELGASADLLALMANSRKAINPGWSRWGTLGLAVGVLSAASLLSGLYVVLRFSRVLESIQIVGLLFMAILSGLGVIAFLAARRADHYVLQRFSHEVVTRRSIQAAIGGLLIATATLWVSFASHQLRIEKLCADLGFVGDALNPNVALTYENLADKDVEFFRQRLIEVSDLRTPNVRAVSAADAQTCRRFLDFHIQLRAARAVDQQNPAYFAVVLTSDSVQAATEREESSGNCSALEFLASKVAVAVGFSSAIIAESDTAESDTNLLDCGAYRKNRDGYKYLRQRRYDDAESMFKAALEVEPQYAYAHANLGQVYDETGRFADAILEYQEALRIMPASKLFLKGLAIACYDAGDYSCAEQATLALIDTQRDLPVSTELIDYEHQLSVIYREWSRQDKTLYVVAADVLDLIDGLIPYLQEVDQQRYHQQVAEKNRGILAYYQHDYRTAAQWLTGVNLEGFQHREQVLYYLAMIAEEQGLLADACTYWKQFVVLEPDEPVRYEARRRREDGNAHLQALNCR